MTANYSVYIAHQESIKHVTMPLAWQLIITNCDTTDKRFGVIRMEMKAEFCLPTESKGTRKPPPSSALATYFKSKPVCDGAQFYLRNDNNSSPEFHQIFTWFLISNLQIPESGKQAWYDGKDLTWPSELDRCGFKPCFRSTSLSISFLASKTGNNN